MDAPRRRLELINYVFSDQKAFQLMKFIQLLRIVFEILMITIGFYILYVSLSMKKEEFVQFFICIHIVLQAAQLFFSLQNLRKLITTEQINDVRYNFFDTLLETMTYIFYFLWGMIGLNITKAHTYSFFYIPLPIRGTFWLSILTFLPILFFLISNIIIIALVHYALMCIPQKKYRNLKNKTFSDCSICLSEYQNDDKVRILKCDHYFHSSCVDRWLRVDKSCPFCRKPATILF